jgi:hypothetical protein
MEFRAGSPADAEAIADLIASFQSELTDDPSGAGAERYLVSVSVKAERDYLACNVALRLYLIVQSAKRPIVWPLYSLRCLYRLRLILNA